MNISVQSESEFEIHPLHIQWVDVFSEEEINATIGEPTTKPKKKLINIKIYYGVKFLPSELIFQTPSLPMAMTIKKELEQLKNYVLSCPYSKTLDYFLYKQFEELLEKTGEELNGDETIAKDTFIAFMKSITGQVSSKEIKNYMNQKYLSEDEFKEIYKGTSNLRIVKNDFT